MKSKQSVLGVCLILALSTCDSKLLPLENRQSQLLQERQGLFPGLLPTAPPCGSCVITPGAQLNQLAEVLKDVGPVIKKTKAIVASTFNITFTNVAETQAVIRTALQDMKDTILPFLGNLSAAAASVKSCPALKVAFDNMYKIVDRLLAILSQNGPSSVTAPGLEAGLDAFQKTLVTAVPEMFPLVRDLVYNLFQIAGLDTCPLIGPAIYFLFDPNGIAPQLVINFLNTGGNAATSFVKLLFGDLIPGGKEGGVLDLFGLLTKLLCGLVGGAIPGSDIGEVTGGFCPSGSGPFDLFGFLKDLLCEFLGLVDTGGSKSGVCAPGSSVEGNSGLLGALGGVVCGVLKLLNLEGILGLCPADGTKQVDILIGLACEVFKALGLGKALGGIATPFCPSG